MGKKSKSKSSKSTPCYHGCATKKDFNSGKHYTILESYDKQRLTKEGYEEFLKTNALYMVNPIFGCFVIAHVTDDYLKGKNHDLLFYRLLLVLDIKYQHIPWQEGQDVGHESEYTRSYNKHFRDIATERGRIKVIAREIPCNCMDEKLKEAKLMEKNAMCFFCMEEFSKEKMLRCKGCNDAQYCSKECSKKDYVASATTQTPAAIPSSLFVEPSDNDEGD